MHFHDCMVPCVERCIENWSCTCVVIVRIIDPLWQTVGNAKSASMIFTTKVCSVFVNMFESNAIEVIWLPVFGCLCLVAVLFKY